MWLTGGVIAVIAVVLLILIALADVLTSYIPFSVEKDINFTEFEFEEKSGALHDYLQSLADRISEAEDLPEGMTITVHYLDDDTVNAFATLGGHVFLFKGLLEKLPNENALTMLLAHEIAHVKHRHPIRSLGRGVVIGLAMSVVSTAASDVMIESFLGEAGYLTILKYSRDMESQSDETAIAAVISIYGHLAGAEDLFTALQAETANIEPPEFFSTHPLTEDRINNLSVHAEKIGENERAEVTFLPDDFSKWLKADDN